MDQAAVVACSALKETYRKALIRGIEGKRQFRFVYLKIDEDLVKERVARRDHFFPEELIDSQFRDLEEPSNGLVIDARQPVSTIVSNILSRSSQDE